MVRFLHTADWHLGIKFRRLGPNAEEARRIRIETVRKLVETAKEKNVDFILVAGDLFDSNDVDRGLIDIVTETLRGIRPVTTYILPGNHDPLTRDSLYWDPQWESVDNVVILEEAGSIEIPEHDVFLHPCPVRQKQTGEDLTECIDPSGKGISIGVAHGNLSIEGFVEDANFPIDPQRTEKSGLDYLALGEWHSLFMHKGKDKIVRTVYPGTPETTKFGEKESGKAVIVEIMNPGSKPNIKEIETGTAEWEEWIREVSEMDDLKHIENELDKVEIPEFKAISLSLRGVVDHEVAEYLDTLVESQLERFLYFGVKKDDLYLKPNLAKLKAMIPEGAIFEKCVKAIQALMKCEPSLQEHSGISSEEADEILKDIGDVDTAVSASPELLERAILLLYQAAKEASV